MMRRRAEVQILETTVVGRRRRRRRKDRTTIDNLDLGTIPLSYAIVGPTPLSSLQGNADSATSATAVMI
jgi:hypothetical protein